MIHQVKYVTAAEKIIKSVIDVDCSINLHHLTLCSSIVWNVIHCVATNVKFVDFDLLIILYTLPLTHTPITKGCAIDSGVFFQIEGTELEIYLMQFCHCQRFQIKFYNI